MSTYPTRRDENYMMHFRQHCMGTSEDKILSYKTALGHTRELIDSLAVTRHALEQYLEQVQEAAMHLRKKMPGVRNTRFF